jgi:hypothetical protein
MRLPLASDTIVASKLQLPDNIWVMEKDSMGVCPASASGSTHQTLLATAAAAMPLLRGPSSCWGEPWRC